MRETRKALQAAIVAVAPLALLGVFLWHPFLPGRLPNESAIAAAVVADHTRWGLSHLFTGVASGLLVLAFLAVRSYLREAGEDRWSGLGVPFIVMGSMLFTLLPGMEFAPLAAAEAGGDPGAAQAALGSWFVSTLMAGAVTFAVGVLSFARGLVVSRVLSAGLTGLVVVALLVMAASRFVPLAAVQFYVQGTAAILALWPLAYAIGKQSSEGRAGQPRPMPAT